MVVIRFPAAANTGVMQDRVGCPSMWIVHAPHSPMPQPNFVPVIPRTSRSVQSSGISSGTSSLRGFPFTLSVIMAPPLREVESVATNASGDGVGRLQRECFDNGVPYVN